MALFPSDMNYCQHLILCHFTQDFTHHIVKDVSSQWADCTLYHNHESL